MFDCCRQGSHSPDRNHNRENGHHGKQNGNRQRDGRGYDQLDNGQHGRRQHNHHHHRSPHKIFKVNE